MGAGASAADKAELQAAVKALLPRRHRRRRAGRCPVRDLTLTVSVSRYIMALECVRVVSCGGRRGGASRYPLRRYCALVLLSCVGVSVPLSSLVRRYNINITV
jgi:hypothetical protein